ncbi:hypothetical protein PHG204 (plasmid) [Cupriavidus necator H16]|uniref:Uncharacterized protein n=1 Tax=Cupriavidus necator (strain ATCC 17699 / DSM 428 / KCTC 22496 / NCIMB 10442 / H16 / Stanier 337) TaxID=381666 RepID=Q7WXD0_CUPNH|nr:hypothetical protein PHG204 [Cupriavidus necator H16]
MKPTVLLILAHPDKRGFGGALAEAYVKPLQAQGCDVEVLHLPAMEFDATPAGRPPELEADLVRARAAIQRAVTSHSFTLPGSGRCQPGSKGSSSASSATTSPSSSSRNRCSRSRS